MDPEGRPSFSLLQNYSSAGVQLLYFVFDLLILRGKDLMHQPLSIRRELLQGLLPKLAEPVRYVPPFDVDLKTMIRSVKEQGFEGVIAKRNESRYEPGLRSGLWQKMRVNQGQEFVVGGYSKGNPFDALIFGYYEDGKLMYAGRTRAGFTPVTRASVFKKFKGLEIAECPFVNLPQKKAGRWGAGLTKEKMKDCVWLRPQLVAQIQFLEWTPDGNLRHTKFVGLREDKDPRGIVRKG